MENMSFDDGQSLTRSTSNGDPLPTRYVAFSTPGKTLRGTRMISNQPGSKIVDDSDPRAILSRPPVAEYGDSTYSAHSASTPSGSYQYPQNT